jgi:hypothetical protein
MTKEECLLEIKKLDDQIQAILKIIEDDPKSHDPLLDDDEVREIFIDEFTSLEVKRGELINVLFQILKHTHGY